MKSAFRFSRKIFLCWKAFSDSAPILITEYYSTNDANEAKDADGDSAGLAVQNDGIVFCTACCKTFKNIRTGKNHFSEVHQPTVSAICKICQRVFKNQRSRDNHYSQTHKVSATAMKNLIVPNKSSQI